MKKMEMVEDISYGICSMQTTMEGKPLIAANKKLQQYQPKTDILDIIHSIAEPAIKEIKQDYSWHHENEFYSEGDQITLVTYEPFADWCVIKRNDESPIRINKKYFHFLYQTSRG